LVIDVGAAGAAPAANGPSSGAAIPIAPGSTLAGPVQYGGRVRAGMLANRATTIARGALIPAVLETALDSSRPGIARAVVSRDVRGFDGSRVLVPRGSRLVGEYLADAAAGQLRAMINWTRLVRPDGVTIALDSPAGDPLGRGGIGARTRSNGFIRFLGGVLQTAIDAGISLVGGRNQQTVVVANGADAGVQAIRPAPVTRSLTVRAGTSISVLVARDLDFTGVENAR
jgi:type IV secretion system protein VirB10